MANHSCPLCGSSDTAHYHTDKRRDYWQCAQCELVFVPPQFWLTPEQEKAEYDLHENNPEDGGYRRFLSRFADPLCERLKPNSQGLDFGCGPGPLLAKMLEERGHSVTLYDKFYADNLEVLEQQYDFICSTEVFEHLHQPRQVIEQLVSLLKPNGVLGVMTKRVIDKEKFASWHYKNDLTHIVFFADSTFDWLAREFGLGVEFVEKDVVFLTKVKE